MVIAAIIRIGVTAISFVMPKKLLGRFDFSLSSDKRIELIKAYFKVIRMILKNVHTYQLEESGYLTNKFIQED